MDCLLIYFIFSGSQCFNDAVVYGKVLKMALNMRLAIIAIFRVQLYLFYAGVAVLPVQYLARNMLFNRLSVHFAQGVKIS